MNPILRRELLDILRTRKALVLQASVGIAAVFFVLVRWPSAAVADLSGARALEVLRVLGYGLLACIVFLVPAFPATTLVREKLKGTLALLLNSPLTPLSIYLGKLGGVLGFSFILLLMTLPAAAACYAIGGTGNQGGILNLYIILILTAIQLSTISLLISSYAQSVNEALRTTYAAVLALCVIPVGVYALLRGTGFPLETIAGWIRCLSPFPAMMDVLGHTDVGSFGLQEKDQVFSRYMGLSLAISFGCALTTILRLNHKLFDRARPAGIMTQDRSRSQKTVRRLFFLLDPQRRSSAISLWSNAVLMKEIRSRRFGRSHWLVRQIALCAILSLGISYIAASGALGWGVEFIGGLLVLLQVALLILFGPNLAAGLISSERETGSWQLLRMTPLHSWSILFGKLLSVVWPLLLILCATVPGYVVMMSIKPTTAVLVYRVLISLGLTSIFIILVSAVCSTLFRSTAQATTAAFILLVVICIGPLLIWLGRDAPFGFAVVEAVLLINPVAAALNAAGMQGFTEYRLLPWNWWIIGIACIGLLLFLMIQTWRLTRPE